MVMLSTPSGWSALLAGRDHSGREKSGSVVTDPVSLSDDPLASALRQCSGTLTEAQGLSGPRVNWVGA